MGIIETVRTKYPVETAVVANNLYAVYLWISGDIQPKVAIGMCLQSIIFALLGSQQRVNSQNAGQQNEAILQNQAAMAAADTSIKTEVVASHMAPRTADTALRIASQLPPDVEIAKERNTNGVKV